VTLRIDVFSDVVCPWCYIGTDRLEQALRGVDDVDVRFHPFLLDPSTPAEGTVVADMLRKKYGADPKHMFARVEAAARESGLALDLSKQPRSYPTAAAHALLGRAPEGKARALARDLFRAHFDEGRNVSDPEVLAGLGARHGIDAEEAKRIATDPDELRAVREDAAGASASGIRGVPFFVFDEKLAVSGAQPVAVLQEAMRKAALG